MNFEQQNPQPVLAPLPETMTEASPQAVTSPLWRVVVWDDPINLFQYVVWVFQKTFGYSEGVARGLTEKIHFQGKASVWTGERERAEMYVQKMHGYQLRATLEKNEE